MIHLTTLPSTALAAYDSLRPDGLTKEVVARAAALNLVAGAGDAAALATLHDLLDPTVLAAVAAGAGVVNPVVKRLVALDAVNVPPGLSASDATAALAGAVYDVVNGKPLVVAAPAPPAVPPGDATADQPPPDLTGLDLLGPACEPLRVVLTRTLRAVRPDLYAAYRDLKDGGSPDARERAYGFAFFLLAIRTGQTFGPAGG